MKDAVGAATRGRAGAAAKSAPVIRNGASSVENDSRLAGAQSYDPHAPCVSQQLA
jgi:hypothetical protein